MKDPFPRVLPRRGAPANAAGDVPVPHKKVAHADYLAFVGAKPCCACSAPGPSDAHHFGSGKGMGQKVSDYRTVPLCRLHHGEWHFRGRVGMMDHAETEGLFLKTQVTLLVEWLEVTK